MRFELLVAVRYLKAKRKQAVISLITIISIVGVAAGVAALIIALAINAGFTEDLQKKLLGAQAHIRIARKDTVGINDYLNVSRQAEQVEGVVAAAPSIYQPVLISSASVDHPAQMKGVIPEMESRMSALSSNIVEGRFEDFGEGSIIVGRELANAIGVKVGDRVSLLHMKDGVPGTEFPADWRDGGEGIIDWPAILEAAEGNVDFYVLERDSAPATSEFVQDSFSFFTCAELGDPSVTVGASSVAAGSAITAKATGFTGGRAYALFLPGGEEPLGTATADEDGAF